MIRTVTYFHKVTEFHPFGTTEKYVEEQIHGEWDTIDAAYEAACAHGADPRKRMTYDTM